MKTRSIIATFIFSGMLQLSCHASALNLKLLNEEKCTNLKLEDLTKLPVAFLKYGDFTKLCRLNEGENFGQWSTALVSIWAHEYLRSKGGATEWEHFPSSILVDRTFNVVGELPEIYPMDWATHLAVNFGKWHAGRPEEITVDVSNPAVSGDYYYAPLKWNRVKEKYEMTSQEPITGKRPK